MNKKEEIIDDFFRAFRITLTHAFSYSNNHPYFIKSIENFKLKLDETFNTLNPLKISVTNLGLIVDGQNLTKVGFYDELAHLLHQRKIKSITIKSGVVSEELVGFFSTVSMSQADIFKKGGINVLLEKQQTANLVIEELDYSAFLSDTGQECTDVWSYILKEAANSNDITKLNKIADDFGNFIKHSNEKDILEGEEIPANINEFLTSLKSNNKEKFDKCSKEVFLWLLHNQRLFDDGKIAKLKPVFNSLNHEDFSTLLLEGLTYGDNFDALSLELFSKIAEQKNSPKIAEVFSSRISNSQHLLENPKVVKKIQDLLSTPQDDPTSAAYRKTLESFIKGVSSSGVLTFDQMKLRENYRYVVLSMLANDSIEDNLKLAVEILAKEFALTFEDNDINFFKDLYDLVIKRRKEGVVVFKDLEKKLSAFIENIILSESLTPEQEFLMGMVSSSAFELNFYLYKIFIYGKANKQVLTLFFRLFSDNLDAFYERLEKKIQDMEFLFNLLNVLSQLDSSISLSVLEHIYLSVNELIKIDVLKTMRKLKRIDINFLTRQLSASSFLLRRGLYSVLILDVQAKSFALELLFKFPSFFGAKNKLLMENMQIAFDLGLVDAIKTIQDLSRRKFPWNKELRKKAKQILKEWHVL